MNKGKDKDRSGSGGGNKHHPGPDSPSRMDRPVAGNPDQRKRQVQDIANDVMSDREESDDDLERGNYPSQAQGQAQSQSQSQTHHIHHNHMTGHSHTVECGQDCPECGTEYMNGR